jgi:hypothetical protein
VVVHDARGEERQQYLQSVRRAADALMKNSQIGVRASAESSPSAWRTQTNSIRRGFCNSRVGCSKDRPQSRAAGAAIPRGTSATFSAALEKELDHCGRVLP